MNAAERLDHISPLKSVGLHPLKGDRKGQWAIAVAMVPIHPGRILRRELKARQLSANALARALRVPSGRIVDILNGKRSVTAETALRLGRYFGNAPQFWVSLQAQYDLAVAMRDVGELVEREVQTAA